jgi:hypothetical protein
MSVPHPLEPSLRQRQSIGSQDPGQAAPSTYTELVTHNADEQKRKRREAEELDSFKRRAEWSRLHYGVPADEADQRTQEALEQAERMPPAEDDVSK